MARPDTLVGPVCLSSNSGCLSSPPLFPDTTDSPSSGVGQPLCLTLCQSLDITHLAQDQWGREWEGDTEGPAGESLPQNLGQILCQVRKQQGHWVWTSLPSQTPWSSSQPLTCSAARSQITFLPSGPFRLRIPVFPLQSNLLVPRVLVPFLGRDPSLPFPCQVPGCLC